MDNYNNNNNQNNSSQYYETPSYNMQGNNTQYYENASMNNQSNVNDPWANQVIQHTDYTQPPNTNQPKMDNNKIVMYVAIALGGLAVLMAIILLVISVVDNKLPPDVTEISEEETTEEIGQAQGKASRNVSDYVKNGVAHISSNGVTYYAPEFRIAGSYVSGVIDEINSDLNRLRIESNKFHDNAVFQYKAYLNGDVLSIKFESGYPGDMKSRYYNINVNSGSRASLRELQIQAGMSEDEFGARLLACQRKELNKIYAANGWGDINSTTQYCRDCWNSYNSEAHLKEVRYYLDDNCKIHIVNYYPGDTADVMVIKDVICEF